jgi:hypothetical protein
MSKLRRLILPGCLVGGLGFVLACCAGVIRPPRPMFCDGYAAGGFGLVPYWIPNTPLRDAHGHWLWVDKGDNVLAIHATGTADSGRSHAMTGGRTQARIRLGSAWDDVRDNQYVTVPRVRDALVVVLPDGRWTAFDLDRGQAERFYRAGIEEEVPDLLRGAGSLLDEGEKARFEEFLAGYEPPQAGGRKGQ